MNQYNSRPKKIIDYISEEDFLKVINHPKVKKNMNKRTAYLLGFYQCLRVSEVVKLLKSDYDPTTGFLKIREAKGSKDRTIPLAPECRKIIKFLPLMRNVRSLQRWIKSDAETILQKNIHFHTLRHSGATYYHNSKNWDVRYLSQFLGHSSISTTQIYTHVAPKDLGKIMWEDT